MVIVHPIQADASSGTLQVSCLCLRTSACRHKQACESLSSATLISLASGQQMIVRTWKAPENGRPRRLNNLTVRLQVECWLRCTCPVLLSAAVLLPYPAARGVTDRYFEIWWWLDFLALCQALSFCRSDWNQRPQASSQLCLAALSNKAKRALKCQLVQANLWS